jgi:hypothetical protein
MMPSPDEVMTKQASRLMFATIARPALLKDGDLPCIG